MSDLITDRPLPRSLLAGAGGLVALVLMGVAMLRAMGPGIPNEPPEVTVAARQLYFRDASDGAVHVVDAATLHPVGTVAAGTNAFLRSTVRGLVRERKRRGIGAEIPFRLSAQADGRLLLDDSATGRRIDLAAFGASNAEVFASLLLADADRRLVTLH